MLKCAVERGCWLQSSVLEAVRDVMMERIRDKVCGRRPLHLYIIYIYIYIYIYYIYYIYCVKWDSVKFPLPDIRSHTIMHPETLLSDLLSVMLAVYI